jgi:ribose/xylose/arabinose/galactoside ABC-type transport system permease subunit
MEVYRVDMINTEKKKSNLNLNSLAKHSVLIFFVFMLLLNSIITPNFFNLNTFWNLIIQSATIIIVSMSMTLVISSGGIDISVGSIMAVAGMTVAQLLPNYGAAAAIGAGILVGLVIGMLSGFIISTFRIQPIIITLSVMISGRGIAKLIGDGNIISIQNNSFSNIGMLRPLGIPVQLVYVAIVVAVFMFISKKTVFARYIEAMGDNFKAAVYSGVKAERMTVIVYGISGFMAALAGMLIISRAGASDPATVGMGAELDAIAAVAIGGTPMSGGKAKIIGTLVGALIMQLITITFNMNDIPYDWSLIAKTVIILFAVYVQKFRGKN